mgnify:CR=1 FL=1
MQKHNHIDNDRITLLIYKSILGTITPEECAELEQWRKASPRNEESYQRLTDLHFLEHEYRRLKLVDSKRPMRDMEARIKRNARPRRLRWAATLATAASMAAMFCIGYFWNKPLFTDTGIQPAATLATLPPIPAGKTQATLTLGNGQSIILNEDSLHNAHLIAKQQPAASVQAQQKQINKLTTPRGGEFKIMLEDSTEVWLNAESQLIYPENFDGKERRVQVNGEAYFKVKKDSLRPFYVESAGMEVRVYGTEFNVHAYNEDPNIYTTLISGSIALKPINDTKAELVLTPGHQAIFQKEDQYTVVRPVNARAVTSWHKGRFSFEEQTLEQIMQDLSRWYCFDYEITSSRLANTVFKGSAPRYSELSEVLSILEKSGGISFHVQGEKIIITTN